MNQFRVSKSFLDCEALARQLQQDYPLSDVNCQLITATIRDVYLVTSAQGRNVLYIYPAGRLQEEIIAEWRWADYLYGSGVSVAPAVRNGSSEHTVAFCAPEGVRYGVLTQFVQGVILRRASNPGTVRAYGELVARMHVQSDRMPFELARAAIDLTAVLEESVAAFAREIRDRPDDLVLLRTCAAILTDRLSKLGREKPAYGMIHGDVIRANALVANDDRITILDFDFCGYGWRAYDVASYLHTIRRTPAEREFEQAFLDGYNAVRPLTRVEQAMLPLFEAVRAIYSIGVPAMNIEHWGSQYLYALLDHELATLREIQFIK